MCSLFLCLILSDFYEERNKTKKILFIKAIFDYVKLLLVQFLINKSVKIKNLISLKTHEY